MNSSDRHTYHTPRQMGLNVFFMSRKSGFRYELTGLALFAFNQLCQGNMDRMHTDTRGLLG
ncbi:MAG: hypothetical protein R6U68_03810, partial [Desulfobacteraceae bacterium]